jgi:hypothetical protein
LRKILDSHYHLFYHFDHKKVLFGGYGGSRPNSATANTATAATKTIFAISSLICSDTPHSGHIFAINSRGYCNVAISFCSKGLQVVPKPDGKISTCRQLYGENRRRRKPLLPSPIQNAPMGEFFSSFPFVIFVVRVTRLTGACDFSVLLRGLGFLVARHLSVLLVFTPALPSPFPDV